MIPPLSALPGDVYDPQLSPTDYYHYSACFKWGYTGTMTVDIGVHLLLVHHPLQQAPGTALLPVHGNAQLLLVLQPRHEPAASAAYCASNNAWHRRMSGQPEAACCAGAGPGPKTGLAAQPWHPAVSVNRGSVERAQSNSSAS